jgi:hypothetical protein
VSSTATHHKAARRRRAWTAARGGNRTHGLHQAVIGDDKTVAHLPEDSPRRKPTVAHVEFLETWLTLEELEEIEAKKERRRRAWCLKKFGIPIETWDIAAAPHVAQRFWQWGATEPLVVGAFYLIGRGDEKAGTDAFECCCREYWVSYVVLPMPPGEERP